MNLNEIITYAPNVTVCITANDVVGTVKIMDVDESGTETGLVLAVLPEGAVSQTPVTLQSGSIKAVAETGATVGSIQVLRPVAPFKAAPALASAGGGMDIIPQDGGVYGVTYVDGQYKGVAVDRKPLIEKTVYDDISQMTQVLPPGTYDFEMEKLAVSETTGGDIFNEYYYNVSNNEIDTKHRISSASFISNVSLISAVGSEYELSSTDELWKSPLRIDAEGIYMQRNATSSRYTSVGMANSIVRLTIKPNSTLTFSQIISQMFELAKTFYENKKCIPHVIKVYPV